MWAGDRLSARWSSGGSREGETIAEDQPVVDVMTDKALVEITAPQAGVVSKLHVAQGEIARVHAPLYAYRPEHAEGVGGEVSTTAEPESRPVTRSVPSAASSDAREAEPGRGPYGRIPAAPAVRRLLREHGLSLEAVPGSGKQGRVLKEDVLSYLEKASACSSRGKASVAGEKATAASSKPPAQGEVRVEPLRGRAR